jgi:hypothetical protein
MDKGKPPTRAQVRRLAPRLTPATLKYKVDSREGRQKLRPRVNHYKRQRKSFATSRGWADEGQDGLQLAADRSVLLPSDSCPVKPQLKREPAFRVPKAWPCGEPIADGHDLSILSQLSGDSRYCHGSAYLTLDHLIPRDPVYTIKPARRQRRHQQARSQLSENFIPLEVDLSFSTFCDDETFDRLSVSGIVEQAQPEERRDDPSHGALTVIYELQEDSEHIAGGAPNYNGHEILYSSEEEGDFLLLNDSDDEASGMELDVAFDADGAELHTAGAWVMLGDGL